MPLPIPGARVSSGFDPSRLHPITRVVTPHTGADLAVPEGTPVHPVRDGIVVRSGYDPPRSQGGTGAGFHLRVSHGDGLESRYYHLSVRYAQVGQAVKVSDVIALSGNTGDSTGPHLHFEIRVNHVAVDPIAWLAAHDAPSPVKPRRRDMMIVKDARGPNHYEVGELFVRHIGNTDRLGSLILLYGPVVELDAADITRLQWQADERRTALVNAIAAKVPAAPGADPKAVATELGARLLRGA